VRKSTKLVIGAGFAGLVAAGGVALTGTGLADTASPTQFVGGQVSQTVTGATLSSITYGFSDSPAKTSVNTIDLTFANTADGRTVAVTPHGAPPALAGTFTCSNVSTNASSCTYVPMATESGYVGLTSLDVAVS
jgi:hypothetical protein